MFDIICKFLNSKCQAPPIGHVAKCHRSWGDWQLHPLSQITSECIKRPVLTDACEIQELCVQVQDTYDVDAARNLSLIHI